MIHEVRSDRRLPSFNLLLESSVVSEVVAAQSRPGQHPLASSIPKIFVGTMAHQTPRMIYGPSLMPKLS